MRNEVAHYVDRCMAAGFCKTEDDVRYSTILSRFGLNEVFVLGFFWFFDTTLKGPPEGSPFFAVLIKELSLNEKR